MQVGVIGAGYVGLVTGVGLASKGHTVTLAEVDPDRFRALRDGRVPISEPGLAEAFSASRERLLVVQTLAEAENLDLAFVCVGTPTNETGDSDLRQLHSAAESLGTFPQLHVSVRSTLPPGTSNGLPSILGRPGGAKLSTNPEFLRQGHALHDFLNPSRIVFGTYPDTSIEHLALLRAAYTDVHAPELVVGVAAAELIKNVANGFLALKLSFVNEVASLAEEYGVAIDDVIAGIALDPRIGGAYMRPGMGFGGSCLPKELQVLAAAGRRQGLPMHVARAAAQVNGEQQDRFIRRVTNALKPGAQVGLLGLSFKAFTDDLRGSPAVYLARRLIDNGFQLSAFDPVVTHRRAVAAVPGLRVCESAIDVFRGADAVTVATEWPEFTEIDFATARRLAARPVLFDGRNLLDPHRLVAAGFEYHGIGRVMSWT